MFDVGFWEMAFIGVIALVVIGPERLPGAARNVGLWVGKGRRMINDVKADIKKEMDAQDFRNLQTLKKELEEASDDVKNMAESTSNALGIREAGEQIKGAVGDISEDLKIQNDAGNETAASGRKKPARKKAGGKAAKISSAKAGPGKNTRAKKGSVKKTKSAKKPSVKKSAGIEAAAKKKTSTRKKAAKKKPIKSKWKQRPPGAAKVTGKKPAGPDKNTPSRSKKR